MLNGFSKLNSHTIELHPQTHSNIRLIEITATQESTAHAGLLMVLTLKGLHPHTSNSLKAEFAQPRAQ